MDKSVEKWISLRPATNYGEILRKIGAAQRLSRPAKRRAVDNPVDNVDNCRERERERERECVCVGVYIYMRACVRGRSTAGAKDIPIISAMPPHRAG